MDRTAHSVTRIFNSITIHRPIADVFEYVTTPQTWVHWHPVTKAVSGATDHSLSEGEQVVEEIRSAGGKGQMVWTVRNRFFPHYWRIEGESNIGVRAIITYRMTEQPDGTYYEREVYYWKPGSMLYRLLDKLGRRRLIWAESDKALSRIKQNLESQVAVAH